jgi:hypothetical protein
MIFCNLKVIDTVKDVHFFITVDNALIIIRRLTSFGNFGLLNNVFPFYTVLDTGCPIFDLKLADVLYYVVFPSLGLPLGPMVIGVHLNIFLTVLESGILCT